MTEPGPNMVCWVLLSFPCSKLSPAFYYIHLCHEVNFAMFLKMQVNLSVNVFPLRISRFFNQSFIFVELIIWSICWITDITDLLRTCPYTCSHVAAGTVLSSAAAAFALIRQASCSGEVKKQSKREKNSACQRNLISKKAKVVASPLSSVLNDKN